MAEPGERTVILADAGHCHSTVVLQPLAGKVRVIMASELANPRLAGNEAGPRRSVAPSIRYEDADGREARCLALRRGSSTLSTKSETAFEEMELR